MKNFILFFGLISSLLLSGCEPQTGEQPGVRSVNICSSMNQDLSKAGFAATVGYFRKQ